MEPPPEVRVDDGASAPDRGYGVVWRDPVARLLTAVHGVSGIGDFVALGALLVVATERSGGRALGAAGLLAVQVVPALLTGTVLSGVVARLQPRPALVGSALLGAASLVLVLQIEALWSVYATTLLLGVSRTVAAPMRSRAGAEFVPSSVRPRLIALDNVLFQSVQVAGLLVGSLAATGGAARIALWFDMATFLVAALVVARLPTTAPGARAGRRTPLDGLRVVRDHPVARSLVPAAWAALLLGAVPEAILPSTVDGPLLAVALTAGPAATALTAFVVGRADALVRPSAGIRAAMLVPGAALLLAGCLALPPGLPAGIALTVANAMLGMTLAWTVGAQGALAVSVRPADLAQLTATMVASVVVLEGLGALTVGLVADATRPSVGVLVPVVVATLLVSLGARKVPTDAQYEALTA